MSVNTILDFEGTGKILPKYIPPFPQVLAYGSFSSSSTQYVKGVGQPTEISYNTIEIANQVSYVGSRIYVQNTGVYRFSYSVQLDIDDNKTSPVDLYIRVDGTNVPRSTSKNVLEGKDAEFCPYCDYILQLNAGQYVSVVFVATNATVHAAAFPEVVGQYPAIPSIIANIQQIA